MPFGHALRFSDITSNTSLKRKHILTLRYMPKISNISGGFRKDLPSEAELDWIRDCERSDVFRDGSFGEPQSNFLNGRNLYYLTADFYFNAYVLAQITYLVPTSLLPRIQTARAASRLDPMSCVRYIQQSLKITQMARPGIWVENITLDCFTDVAVSNSTTRP